MDSRSAIANKGMAMFFKFRKFIPTLALAGILLACGSGGAADQSQPAATISSVQVEATSAPAATSASTVTEAPAAESDSLPLYLSTELIDVQSREPFRIAELTAQGKYVLVEMMAVW